MRRRRGQVIGATLLDARVVGGDDHDAVALSKGGDDLDDLLGRAVVEGSSWLVEKEEVWFRSERSRDH